MRTMFLYKLYYQILLSHLEYLSKDFPKILHWVHCKKSFNKMLEKILAQHFYQYIDVYLAKHEA